MAQRARKLQMKTINFQFQGKPTTVGVLREGTFKHRISLRRVPAALKTANQVHKTNLKLVRNLVMEHIFSEYELWKQVSRGFCCPVRELAAYARPGGKLESHIIFWDVLDKGRLIVPTGEFQSESDIALVLLEIPGEKLQKDGRDFGLDFADANWIDVPDFPAETGWYLLHGKSGIPHGEQKPDEFEGARALWRREHAYEGPIVRGGYAYGSFAHAININADTGRVGGGILVEIPEADLAKIEAPTKD